MDHLFNGIDNKFEKCGHTLNQTLREKCPYSEFFWSVFSSIFLVSLHI